MCETVKLDLFDLFSHSGKSKSYTIEYPGDAVNVADDTYEIVSKEPVNMFMESVKDGEVLLKGNFKLSLKSQCDRCLDDVVLPLDFEFTKILQSEEIRDNDDNNEFWMLDGTEFDVVGFLNEEILMNLPSKVLCVDDCAGLCPVCGCNRNVTKCECDTFVPDPRMAGIMDIFKGNKEV